VSHRSRDRLLWALLAVYVAATACHIGWVMAHEPFSFDAWNVAVDTNAEPPSLARFLAYWQYEYAHANPRLGQPLTYLAYKLVGFAELATPLAYLALTLAVVVLGLGRWPRRGREWALWAVAIGLGWVVFPQLGRNLFCRAYSANYIYTAAIQLWFIARLTVVAPARPASALACVDAGMFGVIAGMCNEHTGPALVAFLLGHAVWQRRAGQPSAPRNLASLIAGMLGAGAGAAVILLAPGQGERYGGLAHHAGIVERIAERGIDGNLELFRGYAGHAAALAGLIALVSLRALVGGEALDEPARARRRRAARAIAAATAVGLAITATLLASPKLGSRFYIVPMAALLAGFIALVDALAVGSDGRPDRRSLGLLVAIAVLASGYAAARTVPLFARVSAQGAARMRALAATRPGTAFAAPAWEQIDDSWWFIGDDFRSPTKRAMVARYLGLTRVTLAR
jgi:hypothetical protein